MRRRTLLMSAALLLLAPTVGEFLLGNIPISQYGNVLLLVPLYGAGALLARETGRRCGGWPAIALFASAYALIEEAPVDQMVFNPEYLGQQSFPAGTVVPGLGISGSLVVYSLALHTVWSICVPIALIEAFDPTPTEPWLGGVGLLATGSVFVAGCVYLGIIQARSLDFVGTPVQFVASAVAILLLVGLGILAGRERRRATAPGEVPAPWLVGLGAFWLTSGYWFASGVPGALAQAGVLALAALIAVLLVRRWSRRTGWSDRHRWALGAGAAATYATWFGPAQAIEAGTPPTEIALGAVVFGLAVLVVALLGRRSLVARATS